MGFLVWNVRLGHQLVALNDVIGPVRERIPRAGTHEAQPEQILRKRLAAYKAVEYRGLEQANLWHVGPLPVDDDCVKVGVDLAANEDGSELTIGVPLVQLGLLENTSEVHVADLLLRSARIHVVCSYELRGFRSRHHRAKLARRGVLDQTHAWVDLGGTRGDASRTRDLAHERGALEDLGRSSNRDIGNRSVGT